METINHECYVSLEVAKLLKEAGFNWKNQKYILDEESFKLCEKCEVNFVTENTNPNIRKYTYSAPTLEVAQRWLREVKEYYIDIAVLENKRCVTNSDGWTFHYEYSKPTFDCEIKNVRGETICVFDDTYNTYEEAQEAGIKKVLEIILEKGE